MLLRRASRLPLVGVLVGVLLAAPACRSSRDVPAPAHVDLGGNLQGVVSAFNADKGKVRALFIASPT